MVGKPLRNPKHERFAVLVASGVPVSQAFEESGFSPNPGNARRLRGYDQVAKRIETLTSAYAERSITQAAKIAENVAYGRREAMEESARALNLALSVEQPGAAVAAVALRSKLNGLLVDRKEIGGPGAFADVSDDELRSRLAAALAKLGLPAPDHPREIIDAITVEVDGVAVEQENK